MVVMVVSVVIVYSSNSGDILLVVVLDMKTGVRIMSFSNMWSNDFFGNSCLGRFFQRMGKVWKAIGNIGKSFNKNEMYLEAIFFIFFSNCVKLCKTCMF